MCYRFANLRGAGDGVNENLREVTSDLKWVTRKGGDRLANKHDGSPEVEGCRMWVAC
jgi:hypothetical protein